jgi:hypothetical protein
MKPSLDDLGGVSNVVQYGGRSQQLAISLDEQRCRALSLIGNPLDVRPPAGKLHLQ